MSSKHITNYLRRSQSAEAFRLALCEVAGLVILPSASLLLNRYEHSSRVVYAFEDFSFVVTYNHRPLVEGYIYPKNTIIGEELLRVYSEKNGPQEQWWRILDWSEGYPLYGPFSNLSIPDRRVRFYWVSDWVDGNGDTKKHIRADFDADQPALVDRFWQQVHDAEERTGLALTDTEELSAVDDGVDVNTNMLDFYFRNMLGSRGVIVDLNISALGDTVHRRVRHFARREAAITGRVLIRENGSTSNDYYENEDFNLP